MQRQRNHHTCSWQENGIAKGLDGNAYEALERERGILGGSELLMCERPKSSWETDFADGSGVCISEVKVKQIM